MLKTIIVLSSILFACGGVSGPTDASADAASVCEIGDASIECVVSGEYWNWTFTDDAGNPEGCYFGCPSGATCNAGGDLGMCR